MDSMFAVLLLVCFAVVALIGALVLLAAFLSAAQAQRGQQGASVDRLMDAVQRRRALLSNAIDSHSQASG